MDTFLFDEETKCGFKITSKRKYVWKYELDLLDIFINICKNNNLRYWAFAGTLLGTVRHNGFIPWDDDIDVAMPRKDYDKFVELTENKLDYPYFFQTNNSDANYLRGNVRLRNSSTTAFVRHEVMRNVNYNQGIWLSVFPLDSVPDTNIQLKIHIKEMSIIKNINRRAFYDKTSKNNSLLLNIKILISKFIFNMFGKEKMCSLEKAIATKYENSNTKRFGQVTSFYNRGEKACFKKDWFENTIYHKFENIEIAIPEKYDEFLSHKYGDWKKNIIGTSTHGKVYFDIDTPYTDYRKKSIDLINLIDEYNM